MKIAHISDIHWMGLSRHEEYTRAFTILFSKLREIRPDAIFLGGDYFHTKTSGISPEVIDRLAWMFKSFGDIAPTHAILGNHDGNLANESREDAISPIVKAMDYDRVKLYKGSTEVDIGDFNSAEVCLCVFSCFDKSGWNEVCPVEGAINIAAFHGSVGGSTMDNGWIMPDAKAEVQLSMFDGYDFVLLGDIHKRQFLAERRDKNGVMKPYAAYPGSLIQQNHGEDEVKGFLLWDIRAKDDWDVEFIEIPNSQPFLTIPWMGSAQETADAVSAVRGKILPGSRFRVDSVAPLLSAEQRQVEQLLLQAFKAESVCFQSKLKNRYDSVTTGETTVKKSSLRNSPDVMRALYAQFLNGNVKKFPLSPEQVELGNALIDKFMVKAKDTEKETVRDVSWSLKSIEFDNLYRYGPGNKLNLEVLDGVVGVFGKNKTGKSSLVGALLYTLFNGSDRDGITRNGHIMNQSKNHCQAKAVISVDGTDYVIERSSARTELPKKGKKSGEQFDPEKTETKLSFYRLTPSGRVELNGINREDTDKAIRRLLGSPDDFLATSVATQRRMESFIDEGPTARKTILNRFLDLEVFETLHSYAKEETASLTAKMAALPLMDQEEGEALNDKIAELEKDISNIDNDLVEFRALDAQQQGWLAKNDTLHINRNLNALREELAQKKQLLSKYKVQRVTFAQNVAAMKENIAAFSAKIERTNPAEFTDGVKRLAELTAKFNTTDGLVREVSDRLQNQEKNVRKLSLVPCGDSFPECRYIKDAHEDKKILGNTQQKLAELSSVLKELTEAVKAEKEQRFAEKLLQYNEAKSKLQLLEANLKTEEAKLQSLDNLEVVAAEAVARLIPQVEELEAELNTYNLEAIKEMERKCRELKDKLAFMERQKGANVALLAKLQVRQEMMEKAAVDREALAKELKVLESVQAAFHRNGIPAIVLKTQLPAINQEIDQLLGGLVDFRIIFETEPGSNSLDILIEDGHSKRPLELGSGMEKMIASIAIRVALVNLSNLPKADIFIIDEGFNALDEEHVGKCLELLQGLKQHFKTILVISHMQRVKEASDSIIEVVSTGMDSRIEA
jgi:DNA repair exonuclease SbcCD ATPase subunit/DNA repair exonuclease SbcCD nuclease subunit